MDNYNEIEVKSLLTKDDFVKANKVVIKMKRYEKRWIIYPVASLIIVVAVILGIYKGINESSIEYQIPRESLPAAPWYISYLPRLGLVIFIVYIILIVYLKNAPKRHYDSNKMIQNEKVYIFHTDGISYSSERESSKILWDEFYKVYISKEFIVLFLSNMTVWIIPKRDIQKENIDSIISLIKINLNRKKIVFSNY